VKRLLELVLVAIGFAGTGVAAGEISRNLNIWYSQWAPTMEVLVAGVPFCVLASALCARKFPMAALVAIADCLAWFVALSIRALLTDKHRYHALILAGLVGGLGVAGATGFGCRRLFRWYALTSIGVAGLLAALPFALVGNLDTSLPELCAAFAVWQAAVGTLLFAFSRDPHSGDNL